MTRLTSWTRWTQYCLATACCRHSSNSSPAFPSSPSPTCFRFYDKAHKLDALDFFKRFAVQPDQLPDTVFASIGRTVWRDVGPTAIVFRMVPKVRLIHLNITNIYLYFCGNCR